MEFEWDTNKAIANIQKHGVSFTEATTVFGDPFSMTYPDPDHSIDESRYITIGLSSSGKLLILAHTDRAIAQELLAQERQGVENGGFMKKEDNTEFEDELRPEYDFAQLEGGVRGKYTERYREGTNLVLLEPDVKKAFPTDEAVNEALRMLIRLAKSQVENIEE